MAIAVFLPGILMPASLRYAPLLAELGLGDAAITKELEVYAGDTPPPGYTIDTEVDGLELFANARNLETFHLYGHSGGGAVAIAYVARYPHRVLTLAVDEPASDFTAADKDELATQRVAEFANLPVAERMALFTRTLVRDGVEVPPPGPTPPSPEMAKRPAGLAAFAQALAAHRVTPAALRAFTRPVYFSYGSLSHPRWEAMAGRITDTFPQCTVERYEGLHHINTSHTAEPTRVAAALRDLWAR